MDQKEIDELLKKGSFEAYNQKQDHLIKHLGDKDKPKPEKAEAPVEPETPTVQATPPKKGQVMGQLSRVTEESEEGTNVVMGFMENVLNTVSKQQGFISDIKKRYQENPGDIDINEVLCFVSDSLSTIEENIFGAMDAFQFQDIGRQKLMKVMYTLTRLNEYLNELLGGEAQRAKIFGKKIEEKSLEKDKDKDRVDHIIEGYKGNDGNTAASNDDVDSIVANFKKSESDNVSNDDVENIIAEFQKNK
jgi:hypothetical protein